MSALSKNVRKYAEVGLHRLAVALPSKLSTEELYDYTSLIKQLCNKCLVNEFYFLKLSILIFMVIFCL